MSADDAVIRVTNISKRYRIYDTPRDRLRQLVLPNLRQWAGFAPRHYYQEFYALRNISFAIGRGESVGIIGRNGSGKSTLLQIICGTLAPSSGSVNTEGRVAALLELGSGFNPDFSGRENVYFNAAVIGLAQAEVDARLNEIVEFAGIGDHIGQPVKTYSSGMVVRLAFAVAIHADPQILVIDEALAVGDELFQRKCLSKIESMRRSGVTILFVSHSAAAVVELCDRVLLLDGGELLADGTPKLMVGKYQRLLFAPAARQEAIRGQIRSGAPVANGVASAVPDADASQVPASGEGFDPALIAQSTISYESQGAVIEAPGLLNCDGMPVNCLRRGRLYRFVFRVRFDAPAVNIKFGMLIKALTGAELGGATSAASSHEAVQTVAAGAAANVEFQFTCALNAGTYFLNAGVLGERGAGEIYLHRLLDACVFRVLPDAVSHATGLVDFDCVPSITLAPGSGAA